jgi:replication-associated recombination protein RarA
MQPFTYRATEGYLALAQACIYLLSARKATPFILLQQGQQGCEKNFRISRVPPYPERSDETDEKSVRPRLLYPHDYDNAIVRQDLYAARAEKTTDTIYPTIRGQESKT